VSDFIQSEAAQITYKELEVKRKKMAEQKSPVPCTFISNIMSKASCQG
jgi:hypothetical protein